ncbi:HAD hydrolase-like protein [Myxococcota bacterium]|nr:HAD hydrolase-like protein [Myxococcota bacterium]
MLFIDLDGTILDVTARHYAVYVEALASPELRGQPLPEKEYWALRRDGKPWEELVKLSRLFPTKVKAFGERFDERIESPEMLALDTVRTGVETALGKLYTKTPIILVTQRKDDVNLENQLAALKLRRYFATVLSGTPEKLRRADKDARWKHKASLIKQRYKLLPTEAVYVGDTETDVKAAKSLGFEVYLVEGGHRKRELQIKADPDRLVPDLPAALKYLLPGGRWQR